jgi:hypothetical protein
MKASRDRPTEHRSVTFPVRKWANAALQPLTGCLWRRADSNRRPPACKAGALPTELRPRDYVHQRTCGVAHTVRTDDI